MEKRDDATIGEFRPASSDMERKRETDALLLKPRRIV
jgi:hypothetical protein